MPRRKFKFTRQSKATISTQNELTEDDRQRQIEIIRQIFADKPEPSYLTKKDKDRYGKMRDSYQELGTQKLAERNEELLCKMKMTAQWQVLDQKKKVDKFNRAGK